MAPKLIGIVAHIGKPHAKELVCELITELRARKLDYILESETASLAGANSKLTIKEVGANADIILVLGGDGSILRVVHHLKGNYKPIFGINIGSLGFLTCVSAADYKRALDTVETGSFVLSHRSLLNVEVIRNEEKFAVMTGLNDAVITRGRMSRLVKMETIIDGESLTEYNADGLIVSTPTGSTAYSLSAGGPIVMPDSDVTLITPICPHVLTNRSLIVGKSSVIQIRAAHRDQVLFLTVDGQDFIEIGLNDEVRISAAKEQLPLAMLPELNFSEVLRQKLKWAGTNI